MRDLSSKLTELKFEAPLAQFEEADDWGGSCNDFNPAKPKDEPHPDRDMEPLKSIHMPLIQDSNNNVNNNNKNCNLTMSPLLHSKKAKDVLNSTITSSVANNGDDSLNIYTIHNNQSNNKSIVNDSERINNSVNNNKSNTMENGGIGTNLIADNFTETFSGSLEDLVNNFDEKITKCFGNYEEPVEELAPVQIRTQEEIMSECQVWWTITGNFGNILPIDWTKTPQSTKLQKTAMNNTEKQMMATAEETESTVDDENTDGISSILLLDKDNGIQQENEPIKTADEVIREIDDIMQEGYHNELFEKAREVLKAPLYEEKLRTFNLSQLTEMYTELEVLIREFSETLISELALRDELEYEKELKNTFISLLLAVQNKRRQYHVGKKRSLKNGTKATVCNEPKYLTTVIPYHLDNDTLNNTTLQILIKILKAIGEDSPTVPTLLTDYILKVICPT